MSALEVLAPPSYRRIELLDQLSGRSRFAATCEPTNFLLEAANRFVSRVRIQRPGLGATFDLDGQLPPGAAAALDLVAEKLKSAPNVHDPRFLRVDLHAQLLKDTIRRRQRRTRFDRRLAGNSPVVRVTRELISLATHLPIKGRQEDVA